MVQNLMEKYWEVSMGGTPDLEGFVRRAAQGEFGDVSPADITAFLREVEAVTIANIETKAMEGGPFAMMRDQVIEETRQQVAALIAQYGEDAADGRE